MPPSFPACTPFPCISSARASLTHTSSPLPVHPFPRASPLSEHPFPGAPPRHAIQFPGMPPLESTPLLVRATRTGSRPLATPLPSLLPAHDDNYSLPSSSLFFPRATTTNYSLLLSPTRGARRQLILFISALSRATIPTHYPRPSQQVSVSNRH